MSINIPSEAVKNVFQSSGYIKICRLCFNNENEEMDSIYDKFIVQQNDSVIDVILADILFLVNDRQVDLEALPQFICEGCSSKLLELYLFTQHCRKVEELWSTSLAEININSFEYVEESDSSVDSTPMRISFDKTHLNKFEVLTFPKSSSKLKQLKKKAKKESGCSLQCKYCGKLCSKRYMLVAHELRHEKSRNIPCPKCDERFSYQHTLKTHILVKHTKGNLLCAQCPMKFATQSLLNTHVHRKHVMTTPAHCQICGKLFTNQWGVNRHVKRAHMNRPPSPEPDEPFVCDICNAQFKKKTNVRLHIVQVHGDPKFQCTVCCKYFKTAEHLRGHNVVHSKERLFKCALCTADFTAKSSLLYHIRRLHTGERPYKCLLCDKSYVASYALTEHKRKAHIGPQFPCKYCQKIFSTPSQLKKHGKRHSDPSSRLFVKASLEK